MPRSSEQYRDLLKRLLPPGKAWNRAMGSVISKLLHGFAEEFVRIEQRGEDLLIERDTRTTDELVTDHESDYGLPDTGDSLYPTLAGRREELQASLLKVGQQFSQYFIDIMEKLGYTVIVQEHTPFWAGIGAAGDPCGDQDNLFIWHIYIDIASVTESAEVNLFKPILKINLVKPSHTMVLFDFYNVEFGRGFDRSFSRSPHYDNSWLELDFSRDFDNSFANAYDYDGVNYVGSYDYSFNIAFDRKSGGEFFKDEFGHGFTRPS